MSDDEILDGLMDQFEVAALRGDIPSASSLCGTSHASLLPRLEARIQRWLRWRAADEDREETFEKVEQAFAEEQFRLLEQIAVGGQGAIYLAKDENLDREVAVKRLVQRHRDPRSRQRFEREARIIAQLPHHGILPIYYRGTDATGVPYYAMRRIKGGDLHETIRVLHEGKGDRNFVPLVQFMVRACETLAFAHSRGFVHCDVKPRNLMPGEFGDLFVMDWGLAKEVKAPDAPTETVPVPSRGGSMAQGHAAGTPGYMAPEQAEGRWKDVGLASDVFGLGATLHHILTGQAPFKSLNEAKSCAPVLASTFPSVPRPLAEIARKAMERDPARRFQSATEMGADLDRWLRGEPVSAWREPLGMRLGRWVYHWRLPLTVAGALIVAGLIGVIAWVVVSAARERTALLSAQTERSRTEAKTALGTLLLVSRQFKDSPTADPHQVKQIFQNSLAQADRLLADGPEDREFLAVKAQALSESSELYVMTGDVRQGERFAMEAEAILQRLGKDKVGLATARRRLADALSWQADRVRERTAILSAYELAVEVHSETPDQPMPTFELAACCQGLGNYYVSVGDRVEGERWFRKAITLLEKLPNDKPEHAEYSRRLARCLRLLSDNLSSMGDTDEASSLALRAEGLLTQIRIQAGFSVRMMEDLSGLGQSLADLEEDADEGLKRVKQVEQLIAEFRRINPNDFRWKNDELWIKQRKLMLSPLNTTNAAADIQALIVEFKELWRISSLRAESDPANVFWAADSAGTLTALAQLEFNLAGLPHQDRALHLKSATTFINIAAQQAEELWKRSPHSFRLVRGYSSILRSVALVRYATGELKAVQAAWDQHLKIRDQMPPTALLAPSGPSVWWNVLQARQLRNKLSEATTAKQFKVAISIGVQSEKEWKVVLAAEPNRALWHAEYAKTLELWKNAVYLNTPTMFLQPAGADLKEYLRLNTAEWAERRGAVVLAPKNPRWLQQEAAFSSALLGKLRLSAKSGHLRETFGDADAVCRGYMDKMENYYNEDTKVAQRGPFYRARSMWSVEAQMGEFQARELEQLTDLLSGRRKQIRSYAGKAPLSILMQFVEDVIEIVKRVPEGRQDTDKAHILLTEGVETLQEIQRRFPHPYAARLLAAFEMAADQRPLSMTPVK